MIYNVFGGMLNLAVSIYLCSVRLGRERRHDEHDNELEAGEAQGLRGRRDVQLRHPLNATVILPRHPEPRRRPLGHVRIADARQRPADDGRRSVGPGRSEIQHGRRWRRRRQ